MREKKTNAAGIYICLLMMENEHLMHLWQCTMFVNRNDKTPISSVNSNTSLYTAFMTMNMQYVTQSNDLKKNKVQYIDFFSPLTLKAMLKHIFIHLSCVVSFIWVWARVRQEAPPKIQTVYTRSTALSIIKHWFIIDQHPKIIIRQHMKAFR